jgi:hypothetical protein
LDHSRNYLGQQEHNPFFQRPGILRRGFGGHGEDLTQFSSIPNCGNPRFHQFTVPLEYLRRAIFRLNNQIRSGQIVDSLGQKMSLNQDAQPIGMS